MLYCFSREVYSPKEIARELRDESLYCQCDSDSPPSHQSIRRFLTDLALVVDDVFEYLVEQVAARDLLDNTFRIGSADVHADTRDGKASWNYYPTAETDEPETERSGESKQDTSDDENQEEEDVGCYFGNGCLLVTTDPKLPVAGAATEQKQVDQETARRVTQDALAVSDPLWMLSDAAFDMLAWHDDLIEGNTVLIAPCNERNADDPYDIDHRIEQRIKEHSDTVRVRSKQIKGTHEQRSQVERTIGACKDCDLEMPSV